VTAPDATMLADYARRGFVLMPLKAGLKVAYDGGWNAEDYTANPKVWETWDGQPNALNAAVLTRRSGIFVLDVDTLRVGHPADGEASLAALVAQYGPLPDTYTVRTRAGGLHYYFKDVPGLRKDNRGKVGAGIDIQAGNAYVVAPPSWVEADKSGPAGAYTVEKDLEVAHAPGWLIALAMAQDAQEPRERPQGVPGGPGDFSPSYVAQAVAGEIQRVLDSPAGSGNALLNNASFSLGTLVGAGALDYDEVHMALLDAATHAGRRPEIEARATIKSGLTSGMKHPRVAPDPHEGVVMLTDGPFAAEIALDDQENAYQAEVAKEALRLRIRDEARVLYEQQKAGALTLPDMHGLQDLLDEPDEDVRWMIDGLLSVGGKFMLAAQNKAGKTTAMVNLVRSLADGNPYLNSFQTVPSSRTIVLDDEMNKRDLRRWYRDSGIINTTAVDIVPMRGYGSTFNILVPSVRTLWAERLRGADVVILDCLRPILDALGLDENHDAGRFLEAYDALMAEAGVETYGVVHHMGHAGERARGDSRILDWPDAVWNLRRDRPADPDAPEDDALVPRYFSAYGRDVAVSEGLLAYDRASRALTYRPEVKRSANRVTQKDDRIRNALLRHCTENHPTEYKTGDLGKMLRSQGVPFSKGEESGVLASLVEDGLLALRQVGQSKFYGATPAAVVAKI